MKPAFSADLIKSYKRALLTQVEALDAAFVEADFEKLERLAHKAAGASDLFGDETLALLFHDLERAAAGFQNENAGIALAKLKEKVASRPIMITE